MEPAAEEADVKIVGLRLRILLENTKNDELQHQRLCVFFTVLHKSVLNSSSTAF